MQRGNGPVESASDATFERSLLMLWTLFRRTFAPAGSPPPAAERSETWTALLTGDLAPLDISVERWLDRLEEAR